MVLNYIWVAFFVIAFIVALCKLIFMVMWRYSQNSSTPPSPLPKQLLKYPWD